MTMGDLAQLKPIGVFWDIENCCVPRYRSALCVVQRIRDYFFSGHREAEFMCVCDINKENKQIVQELNSAQINVVHIDAVSKNAADDKLRQSMRRFADAYSPPASVVLISSDVNFSPDLSDLRHRKNFHVILIHGSKTHDALLACANDSYLFEDLVRDLPCRVPPKLLISAELEAISVDICKQDVNGLLAVKVTGLPQGRESNKIRHRLKQLSANSGGRIVSITTDYALLKFHNRDAAFKAKKRMDGEDVYGCKISVDFAAAIEALPAKPGSQPNSYRPEYSSQPVHVPYPESPCRYRPSKPSSYRPAYSPPFAGPLYQDGGNNYYRRSPNRTRQRTPTKGYVPKAPYEMFKRPLYHDDPYQSEHDPNHPSIGSTGIDGFYNHRVYSSFDPNYQHPGGYHDYHGGDYPQSTWPPSPDSRSSYHGRRSPRISPYYHPFRTPLSPPPFFQEPIFNRYSPVYPPETGFQPIRYPTPPPRPSSAPTVDTTTAPYYTDANGPVELAVSNLDYNITAKEWRKILFTTFHPQVKVLNVYVKTQPDNTSIGMVKVPSVEEARFAISQFHRKKIGYKRIHVALKNEDSQQTASNIRAEATALLMEAKGHVLPLFKFIELFDKRYHRSTSVCELYKMKDIIDIREQGGAGRMVYLLDEMRSTPSGSPQDNADVEIQEILEVPVCLVHCPEGSTCYVEALNCTMLPNVNIQMKTFAAQVHTMLQLHEGNMPLMSFVACYEAEFAPLEPCEDGVPLEHLISCVPGTQIVMSKTGVKKVQWLENRQSLPNGMLTDLPDVLRAFCSPLLTQQMSQISREIVDLLKHHPQCRMPFSKFIPAYHHHFGRQCRVADYGYTKLYELFDALHHVLQVMGTGDRRILTLSHRSQVRRFTTDLLRVLKAQPAKQIHLSDLSDTYEKVIGKPLDICEYGMCCPEDLLTEIPATTILTCYTEAGPILSIPRRDQTSEEVERTKQFSLEVVDLLKHNPQCRMPFNKFIPAYHHHFGRQCRVADYGFAKLIELFEAIPHVVELEDEGEERFVRLTEPELKKVLSEQVVKLLGLQYNGQLSLDTFYRVFTCHFGFTLRLRDFNANSMKELLAQLKHVVRIDVQDGVEYVILCRQSHFPKLARQILQLLMNQSSGSLPLVELCSRYKTTFGTDCDVGQIREELLDFVQVTGGEESAVISLTPLQIFARDVRLLLKAHSGRIPLPMFEMAFQDHFGVEIKPALYGFPTVGDLLAAIPHVILLRGRGPRRVAVLSHDMQDVPPICGSPPLNFISSPPKLLVNSPQRDPPPSRTPSKSPSNDSGVMDSQEESNTKAGAKVVSPVDLLSGPVPSAIPSPELRPGDVRKDLMRFESPTEDAELLWKLTDEEKKGQKTPLCRTPTSDLLQFAAQCLQPDGSIEEVTNGIGETENPVYQSGGFRRKLPSHSTPTGLDKCQTKISSLEKGSGTDDTVQELSEAFSKGWWKTDLTNAGSQDKRDGMNTTGDSLNISAVKESLPFSTYMGGEPAPGGESLTVPKPAATSSLCGDSGIRSQDVSETSFQDDPPVDTSSTKSDQSTSLTHLNITPKTSPRKSPRKPRIAAKFLVPIDS